MKCDNCGVVVKAEFTHAISNNQCPGCGQRIMAQAKLASFLSLRTLLGNNILEKNVNIDKLASLIVANFELKQLFKGDGLQKDVEEGIMKTTPDTKEKNVEGVFTEALGEDVEEVLEEELEEEDDPDREFKAKQKVEAKVILERMRDEVLAGAVKDRYGIGDDGLLLPDESMHEMTNREIQAQKRSVIENGSGGAKSFRRSS